MKHKCLLLAYHEGYDSMENERIMPSFSPIADNLCEYLGVYAADSPFFDAIMAFGATNQKWVAVEEMAELTKEISKCYREHVDVSASLIEEFVDVCICMAQIELIIRAVDRNNGDVMCEIFKRKISRLNDKIDEYTNKISDEF